MAKRTVVWGSWSAFTLVAVGLVGLTGCGSETPRQGFDTSPTEPVEPAEAGGESPGDGTSTPAPDTAKTGCSQDKYSEPAPTKVSVSGTPFSTETAAEYLMDALEKRYPIGKALVEGGLASPLSGTQGSCVDRYLTDRSSAGAVLRQAATVVHECGHFFDLGGSAGSSSSFVLRPGDLTFACKNGDTTDRHGKTFARSLIKKDAFYAQREACGGKSSPDCDFYADTYLDGSPTDATFDSGDQGYSFVLEEAAQYVNSLATALAFEDQYKGQKVSERDGILTFLWYIERYHAMARAEYPAAYTVLSEDPCWRQATLSVWDRGWFYLRATKGKANLGINDATLEALVKDPELVAEIDVLRTLECK